LCLAKNPLAETGLVLAGCGDHLPIALNSRRQVRNLSVVTSTPCNSPPSHTSSGSGALAIPNLSYFTALLTIRINYCCTTPCKKFPILKEEVLNDLMWDAIVKMILKSCPLNCIITPEGDQPLVNRLTSSRFGSVNHMPIAWSRITTKDAFLSARKEVVIAYFEWLLSKHAEVFTKSDQLLLRRFAASLSRLLPLLDKQKALAGEIRQMIELAAHAQPERSDTKVADSFLVRYHGNIKGMNKIVVTRQELLKLGKLRGAASGDDSVVSKSYNLLTGDIYEYVSKRILQNLTVEGRRVERVERFPRQQRTGKRVDDWLIATSGGETGKIPVEVKASTNLRYFDSAFRQIHNMEGKSGVFIGFWLGRSKIKRKKILVLLVKSNDSLGSFRNVVRGLAYGVSS